MSRISRQAGPRGRSRQNQEPGAVNPNSIAAVLLDALERDPQLVVLASSQATHTLPAPENALSRLAQLVALRFPARFYGLGELLDDLVPTATRLVAAGLQPVVLMGSADLARSYAGMSALCSQQLRVVFLLAAGTTPGQTWRSSGANDLAILRTLTPLSIGVPSGPAELAGQLLEASRTDEQPVVICYRAGSEITRNENTDRPNPIPGRPVGLGRAMMLREGKELALLSIGPTLPIGLNLATRLAEAGHQAAVVDVRWARPLDDALLTAVAHHFPRLVTLEEGGLEAGFGAAFLEMLERKELYETRVKRLLVTARPSLPRLVSSITAFLDTLQRDEGLPAPRSKPLAHLPDIGRT